MKKECWPLSGRSQTSEASWELVTAKLLLFVPKKIKKMLYCFFFFNVLDWRSAIFFWHSFAFCGQMMPQLKQASLWKKDLGHKCLDVEWYNLMLWSQWKLCWFSCKNKMVKKLQIFSFKLPRDSLLCVFNYQRSRLTSRSSYYICDGGCWLWNGYKSLAKNSNGSISVVFWGPF